MAADDTQMISSRLLCTHHFIKPSIQCPKPYSLLTLYSTYVVIAEAIPHRCMAVIRPHNRFKAAIAACFSHFSTTYAFSTFTGFRGNGIGTQTFPQSVTLGT